MILKVKLLELGAPKAILGLALQPPDTRDIERTILVLKEVHTVALSILNLNLYISVLRSFFALYRIYYMYPCFCFQVGALTTRMRNGVINAFDGDLTFLGRVIGSLPVDIRIGKVLVLGHVFGVLEEALVIGLFGLCKM